MNQVDQFNARAASLWAIIHEMRSIAVQASEIAAAHPDAAGQVRAIGSSLQALAAVVNAQSAVLTEERKRAQCDSPKSSQAAAEYERRRQRSDNSGIESWRNPA